ncbi:MAG: hypothetical protein IPP41_08640 [Rhodocyclaceae bacterium]|nr:hypothetical protein [Rhodocyclaceae bacterium]
MTTPTTADYLKYANLQMAAEAFIYDEATSAPKTGQQLINALMTGNKHASKFTQTQADAFVSQWEVVAQRADTPTGFSGTLFRNKANPNELVLSFRSTEFVDDSIRDSLATNTLELKDTGFAFGQLADMEAWYGELASGVLAGKAFSVTGYSLGGHLATAFNLLHQGVAQQVVTFNGAGVGLVDSGHTLASVLQEFNNLRASPQLIANQFFDPVMGTLYLSLQQGLSNGSLTIADARNALNAYQRPFGATEADSGNYATISNELKWITDALDDIATLQTEAARIAPLTAGGSGTDSGTHPNAVPLTQVDAMNLNYRMAVGFAAQHTTSSTLLGDLVRGLGSKDYGAPLQINQWDVVGTETTTPVWSAVANSMWHYGADVKVFIEDQPFTRGSIISAIAQTSLDFGDVKLLVDNYNVNGFADNHSLVLLIDSLNVQNTLLQLLPENLRTNSGATLDTILKAASWRKAKVAATKAKPKATY